MNIHEEITQITPRATLMDNVRRSDLEIVSAVLTLAGVPFRTENVDPLFARIVVKGEGFMGSFTLTGALVAMYPRGSNAIYGPLPSDR